MLRSTTVVCGFMGVLKQHKFHPDGLPLYNEMNKQWLCREGERWWTLDAKGEQLPRVAEMAAEVVTGRMKPDHTPGMFASDHVIIQNCNQVVMVGDDWIRVPITWQTAWPGGKYRIRLSDMFERDPCLLMWYYVRKCLTNAHGKNQKAKAIPLEKVWVYEDSVHPHVDKSPRPLEWHDHNRTAVQYKADGEHRAWTINEFTQ